MQVEREVDPADMIDLLEEGAAWARIIAMRATGIAGLPLYIRAEDGDAEMVDGRIVMSKKTNDTPRCPTLERWPEWAAKYPIRPTGSISLRLPGSSLTAAVHVARQSGPNSNRCVTFESVGMNSKGDLVRLSCPSRTIRIKNNEHLVDVPGSAAVQLVALSHIYRCGLWTVGFATSPSAPYCSLTTDAEGAHALLRMRDVSAAGRRSALIGWVRDYYRTKRDGSSVHVRTHLRGRTECSFGGFHVRIWPSYVDLDASRRPVQ